MWTEYRVILSVEAVDSRLTTFERKIGKDLSFVFICKILRAFGVPSTVIIQLTKT